MPITKKKIENNKSIGVLRNRMTEPWESVAADSCTGCQPMVHTKEEDGWAGHSVGNAAQAAAARRTTPQHQSQRETPAAFGECAMPEP
jgi:hypothetical protein